MIPSFVILDRESGELVKKIEGLGFSTFFREYQGPEWFMDQFPDNGTSSLSHDKKFVITFAETVSSEIWVKIWEWLENQFEGKGEECVLENFVIERPSTQHRDYFPPGEVKEIDGEKVHVLTHPPEEIDLGNYSYKDYYDEAIDTKYYEVVAPGREIPITVVVANFSSKSDVFLFSDIYACNAWDSNKTYCRYDFLFLKKLWHHLGLEGEFGIEVVKRRVDACYPDRCGGVLEAEPVVYLKSMDFVIGFSRKRLADKDFIKQNS
jgi:hypothetical protein